MWLVVRAAGKGISDGEEQDSEFKEFYDKATEFVDRLKANPQDAQAQTELDALNESITARNTENGMESDDGTILYKRLIEFYDQIRQHLEVVESTPTSLKEKRQQDRARGFLISVEDELDTWLIECDYPEIWGWDDKDTEEDKPIFQIKIEGGDDSGDDGGNDREFKEEIDPEDLFVPQEIKRKPGQAVGVNEGWKASGQSEEVIVRYGPLNSAIYRLEKSGDLAQPLDKKTTEDFTDNRLGDKKIGKRWLYTRRHLISIQGVAFEENGFDDPLEELKPKYEDEKRRYRPLQIKVKWLIDGLYHKSWETRTTVQRLMGSKKSIGDKSIYVAALEQEERYKAFLNGGRAGAERSPTPSPVLARMIAERSPTPVVDPYGPYAVERNPTFPGEDTHDWVAWKSFQNKSKSSTNRSATPAPNKDFLSPNRYTTPVPDPNASRIASLESQMAEMIKLMKTFTVSMGQPPALRA